MRDEVEIAEKFERLNSLAMDLQVRKVSVDTATFVAYTNVMNALAYVLGYSDRIALEKQLEGFLGEVK